MSRKRYSPEQIIGMLREAEIDLAYGMTVGQVSCQLLQCAMQGQWLGLVFVGA